MSTFLGFVEEIPGISVDRFDGENLSSSAYFLSHCHTDHMIGLNHEFFAHLQQFDKYLYCSSISKQILNANCPNMYVKDIEVDKRVAVEYKNGSGETDILFVTCISAGHCPGSVMFLFERDDKLILYTGDFRINSLDLPKLRSLHFRSGSKVLPKKLTKVYLDTTFFNPNFATFPTRKESVSMICNIIKNWLTKSPRHAVILECSALYGSEFLFMELSKFLNIPVHVRNIVFPNLCRISDLRPHVTTDPYATPIHACMGKMECGLGLMKCRSDIPQENVLTIVASAYKWEGKDTSVIGAWDSAKERTFNICYSTHSSFEELQAFIQYFKPEDIFPCVCPKNLEQIIFMRLKEIKRKLKEEKKVVEENEKYLSQVLKHKDMDKSWTKNY
ncbi:protein artemis [Harpegnathos saltator]|uniref:Protein artemis n=1 Tax=Harpegnathos saltator TaxID=610380 RepID=E2C6B8_HARSA|nr:protein artemis [Harpegnathos saltator]EFN76517.1 Artemis protein [Harpegnathos saltator]